MSIFNKNALSSFFGLSGEDEYDEYDEYEQSQTQAQAVNEAPRPKIRQVRTQAAETEPLTERPSARYRSTETNRRESQQEDNAFNEKKVVSMRNSNYSNSKHQSNGRTNKITIVEPRVYSEAMTIAKRILSDEAVLINFHLVEEAQARRIVDFLTGTVYAIDGDIQRVGDEIFLCTPADMEIDSATAKTLANKQLFDF